MQAWRDPDL